MTRISGRMTGMSDDRDAVVTATGWIVNRHAVEAYNLAYRVTGDRASALGVLYLEAQTEDRDRDRARAARDAGRCLNPAHLHGPSAPVTECRTPDPYGQRRTIDLAVPGAARSGCRPLGCACAGGLGYCSGDS